MKIFEDIKNSIYNPDYYKEVFLKPISGSFKYYFSFALAVSLFLSLGLSFTVIPKLKLFADIVAYKITDFYPSELRVDINGGRVSTNVQEPYFIKVPQEFVSEFKNNGNSMPQIENFVVIDTKNPFDLQRFASYKTFALLTNDSIVYYKDKGIEIQPLESTFNFSVDKNIFSKVMEKISSFVKFIYPLALLGIFIASLFVMLWHLVYLFFGALIIWLIAKIKKINIGYSKAYQLGLHLMTLGIIINSVMFIFGFMIPVPFVFTILLIVITAVNLKNNESLISK